VCRSYSRLSGPVTNQRQKACSRGLLNHRAKFDGTKALKKAAKACLVLHKKSCTRPEVKAAIKHVQSGIDLHVYIPWSRKDLRAFDRQAIKDDAQRIVSGGGDGTLNAVVNAMIRGDKRPKASLGILPLGTANDFAKGAGIDAKDLIGALELRVPEAPRRLTSDE
jgi:diacylglycerol kinase family enzyme